MIFKVFRCSVDILSQILYDKTKDDGKHILTRQPAVLINILTYYQSAIEIFCQLCFAVLAWCHIVPQLNSIDKAKPVAKQGRKTTGLKKIADLPEKLVLKRQIAKANGNTHG